MLIVDEYATIAKILQAKVCDNRLCDIRSDSVQEGMDRARVIAIMETREWDNRRLADALGISEDKVSKSLSTSAVKPRRWQGTEVAKLIDLENESRHPLVATEVRGTGLTPEEVRGARSNPSGAPLSLVGTAWGGAWSEIDDVELTHLRLHEILDYVIRPHHAGDDPDAYAVEIMGESMFPRFDPRERVAVSPRATVHIGDDVIVQLRSMAEEGSDLADEITHVLIKRLVRRGADYVELRQFNPEKTFRVPNSRIAGPDSRKLIHKVTGRI